MEIINRVTVDGQTIHLKGVPNARQLGGYRTPGNKTVKHNLLLRSGGLSGATAEDIRQLVDRLKLGTIMDLRTTAEVAGGADPVIDGVEHIHLKILDETTEVNFAASVAASFYNSADPVAAMVELIKNNHGITAHTYSEIAFNETARKGYSRFFQILLENEEGRSVLWHCTGGKDRTGLAAALLLSALGMDRTTILDDFELTNQFLAQNIRDTLQKAAAYTDDPKVILAVKSMVGVSREYLVQVLDDIDVKFKSMDNCLRDYLGVSDREKRLLQEMYLE